MWLPTLVHCLHYCFTALKLVFFRTPEQECFSSVTWPCRQGLGGLYSYISVQLVVQTSPNSIRAAVLLTFPNRKSVLMPQLQRQDPKYFNKIPSPCIALLIYRSQCTLKGSQHFTDGKLIKAPESQPPKSRIGHLKSVPGFFGAAEHLDLLLTSVSVVRYSTSLKLWLCIAVPPFGAQAGKCWPGRIAEHMKSSTVA